MKGMMNGVGGEGGVLGDRDGLCSPTVGLDESYRGRGGAEKKVDFGAGGGLGGGVGGWAGDGSLG